MKFEISQVRKWKIVAVSMLLIGILVGTYIGVLANPNGTFTISQGIYPGAPSYTIWKEGTGGNAVYYAKNSYGFIDFYGTNASQVIQNAIYNIKYTGNNPATIRICSAEAEDYFILTHTIGINNVEQQPFILDLRGTKIRAKTNGQPVIDLTDAHDGVTILGGWIYGDPTAKPNVGLLMARGSNNNSAGQHIVEGTTFEGYYTKATIYIYGSEENNFISVYARNRQDNGKVLYISSDNSEGIVSPFKTISHGIQSTTHLNFFGGHMLGYGTNSIAITLRAGGIDGIQIFGVMIGANATGIYFDMPVGGGPITGLYFDNIRATDIVPSYAIYAPDAGQSVEIRKLMMFGGIFRSAVKDIKLGANVKAVDWIIERTVFFLDNKGIEFAVTPSKCRIEHPSYKTLNSGNATISASTTTTFNHGLAGIPTLVLASFNSTSVDGWKWTATSTQITITVTPSGTYTVYWYAEYNP